MQLKARRGSSDEIATLHREIGALEDDYQQVQAAIRKSSPQYSALTQPQPLDLKGIQQQLDRDTVLLQYALGEERSYVWAVTQDALQSYVLPKRVDIETVAREVYDSLVARSVVKITGDAVATTDTNRAGRRELSTCSQPLEQFDTGAGERAAHS